MKKKNTGNDFIHGPEKDYVHVTPPEKPSSLRAFLYVIAIPTFLASLSAVGVDGNIVLDFIYFFGFYYTVQCVCRTIYRDYKYILKGQA